MSADRRVVKVIYDTELPDKDTLETNGFYTFYADGTYVYSDWGSGVYGGWKLVDDVFHFKHLHDGDFRVGKSLLCQEIARLLAAEIAIDETLGEQ